MKKTIIISFLLIFSILLTSCAEFGTMESESIGYVNETYSSQTVSTGAPIYSGKLPGEMYPFYLPDVVVDYHKDDTFIRDEVTVLHTDFTISESLLNYYYESVIQENSDFAISFYMIDLETGASFGYNANDRFTPACTIKAGYCLYVMREIALGHASMQDTMVFERKHKSNGTGAIWAMGYGTELTLQEIVYYTIYQSDNVGYYMLVDYFGVDGYNALMEELGVTNRIKEDQRWTSITARDLGLIWLEIYRFKDECEEGAFLWDVATHNLYNFVAYALNDCFNLGYETIAHKSGYGANEFNDAAIVMGEHPYLIVCLTGIPAKTYGFINTCAWCDRIIKKYWQYIYPTEE